MRKFRNDFMGKCAIEEQNAPFHDRAAATEMIVQDRDGKLFGRTTVVAPGKCRRAEIEAA